MAWWTYWFLPQRSVWLSVNFTQSSLEILMQLPQLHFVISMLLFVFFSFFIFFIFLLHYSPWWTWWAFQNCPLLFSFLSLMSPVPQVHILRASSTDSSHLNLCFPTSWVHSGLNKVSFLQGSSSGFPKSVLAISVVLFISLSLCLVHHKAYAAHNCILFTIYHYYS